jgi:methylenetetrahydrofolate dehydrogenase (NADP+)/methenyltetrahydrofolate cyclohydrolase
MTAVVLDGRAVARTILDEVAEEVRARLERGLTQPGLATVLVGDDPASAAYVRAKQRHSSEVGMAAEDHRLAGDTSTAQLLDLIQRLNADQSTSGILVQLPLPDQVDTAAVLEAIDPAKDVDGLHPYNAGRLLLGNPALVPCTPAGVVELLERYQVPIAGSRAVVIGRSNLVGKPVSLLLLARNATVTICHSRTPNLPALTREADILIAAAGRPRLVVPDMVRPGAAVVDVGVSHVDGKLVGDVDPAVAEVAGWLTPNPGGVGPMTRALLMSNTLWAERYRHGG